MRLTCLKCGHQSELAIGAGTARFACVCGQDYSYPQVVNTGIRPNERAAERSRSRAFRAAGLVKNVGGFALGLALLGVLFFPLALVGAGIGLYVLTMLRGPIGRYSGRQSAILALAIGTVVFAAEGTVVWSYLHTKKLAHLKQLQASAAEDLRALLRAQRLHRASTDTYGTFREFRFSPQYGQYTIYLGTSEDDRIDGRRDGKTVTDPLPAELVPSVGEDNFTAYAVGNLDDDDDLDVWMLTDNGTITHVNNDLPDL